MKKTLLVLSFSCFASFASAALIQSVSVDGALYPGPYLCYSKTTHLVRSQYIPTKNCQWKILNPRLFLGGSGSLIQTVYHEGSQLYLSFLSYYPAPQSLYLGHLSTARQWGYYDIFGSQMGFIIAQDFVGKNALLLSLNTYDSREVYMGESWDRITSRNPEILTPVFKNPLAE